MRELQKPIYLCPPRENQLATNGGLKDYITVLAIGYLIAIKPTMKSPDIQTAFYLKAEIFTPLETTALFSSMKNTTSASTGSLCPLSVRLYGLLN